MINEGDTVSVVHCERSKFMNGEFTKWIDEHQGQTFYVLNKYGHSCRLAKVGFDITEEFLEKVI